MADLPSLPPPDPHDRPPLVEKEQRGEQRQAVAKYLPAIRTAGLLGVGGLVGAAIGSLATHATLATFLDSHNGAIGALAAIALVWLGYQQLRTFRSQEGWMRTSARQTRQAIRLARRDFIAANRPRLILRGLRIDGGADANNLPVGIITYTLANVGSSRARIVDGIVGSHTFPYRKPLPSVADALILIADTSSSLKRVPEIVLMGGESVPLRYDAGRKTEPTLITTYFSQADLVILGSVVYADDNGIKRTMGFARRYNIDTHRFEATNDSDYEYAD